MGILWLVTTLPSHPYLPHIYNQIFPQRLTNPPLSLLFWFKSNPWSLCESKLHKLWSVSKSLKGETDHPLTMAGGSKVYTLAEVSAHSDRKDCWLLIDGKVCYTFYAQNLSLIWSFHHIQSWVVYKLLYFLWLNMWLVSCKVKVNWACSDWIWVDYKLFDCGFYCYPIGL